MWHYQAGPQPGGPYFILVPDAGQTLAQLAGLAQQLAPAYGLMGYEGPDRQDQLVGWQAACLAQGLSPDQAIWLGYGQGGERALSLLADPMVPNALTALLLHPTLTEGAVAPQVSGTLPGHRLFLAAGKRDPRAPAPVVDQWGQALQARGVHVTTYWTMTGAISQGELEAARSWLQHRS